MSSECSPTSSIRSLANTLSTQAKQILAITLCLWLFTSNAQAQSSCKDVFQSFESIQNSWNVFQEVVWETYTVENIKRETESILADKRLGKGKLKTYEKLGFKLSKDREQFVAPKFKEFIRLYEKTLDELKIAEADRIYPAVVLVKPGKTYIDKAELRYVTPGKDPWPEDPGFRIYTPSKDKFNLTIADTMRAHRQARFPILAMHDLGHIVGFAQHPKYMKAIRNAFANLGKVPKGSSFYLRLATAVETLSLGNPLRRNRMRKLFITPEVKSGSGFVAFKYFTDHMKKLSEEEVIAHARTIEKNYDELTVDYGGANIRPFERDGGAARLKLGVIQADSIVGRNFTVKPGNYIYPHIIMATDGLELNALLKGYELPNIETAFDYTISNQAGAEWKAEENKGFTPTNSKEVALEIIRDEVARAEFFLWNSSAIPVEKWVEKMLSLEPLDLNDPVALILRDSIYDSEIFKRMAKDHSLP